MFSAAASPKRLDWLCQPTCQRAVDLSHLTQNFIGLRGLIGYTHNPSFLLQLQVESMDSLSPVVL